MRRGRNCFFNFAPQAKIFQKSSVILYIMAPQARKILYTISGGPPETVGYTISEGGRCIINAAHFLKQANRPKSAQNRSTDPSQPRTQVLFRIPRTEMSLGKKNVCLSARASKWKEKTLKTVSGSSFKSLKTLASSMTLKTAFNNYGCSSMSFLFL